MKDAYYFSHDCGARNDPKMLQLRLKFAWEGYGVYFALIEVLREQKEYKYPSNARATLELSLSIDRPKLDDILDTAISVGLLVEEDGFLYSPSLIKRMEKFTELRNKRVEAGRLGGKAKASLKHTSTIKGKKRKEKRSKVNGNFNVFWEEYPKKKNKGTAEKAWNRIDFSNGLFKKIIESLLKAKEQKDWTKENGQYIPYPSTWINAKGWEDELGQSGGEWE